jgi:hypothetical protein
MLNATKCSSVVCQYELVRINTQYSSYSEAITLVRCDVLHNQRRCKNEHDVMLNLIGHDRRISSMGTCRTEKPVVQKFV